MAKRIQPRASTQYPHSFSSNWTSEKSRKVDLYDSVSECTCTATEGAGGPGGRVGRAGEVERVVGVLISRREVHGIRRNIEGGVVKRNRCQCREGCVEGS